jgi:hypothetical protein
MPETSGTIKTDSLGSETSQVRRGAERNQFVTVMAKAFESLDFARISVRSDTVGVAYAIHQMSPKAAEITRQIDRLRLAKEVASDLSLNEVSAQGIGDSISFLQNLCVGPIPIPVASWSPETGSSLFFDGDGFYGDLEISDGVVEYFIKSGETGEQVEIFDTEKIEEGRIPPRLLAILFSKFARTSNEVR